MIGRMSQGQLIAAVGAVVLLVAMFLPWIGVSGPSLPSGVSLPPGVSSAAGDTSENVWKGSTLDIYLLITVIVALVPALLAAHRQRRGILLRLRRHVPARRRRGDPDRRVPDGRLPGRRRSQDRRLHRPGIRSRDRHRRIQGDAGRGRRGDIGSVPAKNVGGGKLDANRLSQGQLVAAVSAIALFIISFLPWFGVSGAVTVGGTTIGGSKNFSLWEAENPLDIYLLIVILVALVPAVLALMGDGADAPMAAMATALLGGRGHAAHPVPGVRHAGRRGPQDRPVPRPDRVRRGRGRRLPDDAGDLRRRAVLKRDCGQASWSGPSAASACSSPASFPGTRPEVWTPPPGRRSASPT